MAQTILVTGSSSGFCNCIAFVEGLRWEGRVEEGVKAHAKREASV